MSTKKPTLIQGAMGVRGPYRTIKAIPYDETPLGTNWLAGAHAEVRAQGWDRSRVLVWIDYNNHYIG